jgi:hypothetical protein
MHRVRNIFFYLIISLFITIPAFAEWHTTQDLTGIYYHVEGNKSRSFYPSNDVDYLYESTIDFSKVNFKGMEAFGNINWRSTNDRTVDTQDFSIERMYFGLRGENKEILMGDFYQNFSDYSLANAIKGVKLTFGDEKSHRLIMVSGMDTSKWEDLWEVRQDDSATRRYVWGSRLENFLIDKKLSLNFNYGGARDDEAYIPSSTSPILVNVFSIDSKYNINSILSAKAEIAQSFTDEDVRLNTQHTKSDHALKFGLDLNLKDYSASGLYSRVGNHFNTTGGFTAQDLETGNFDAIWFLPKKIKFTHYFHSDRDNLSNTKSTTTNNLNPGGKFSVPLPGQVNLDFGADLRKRYSTDKSVNEKTYTYTSGLSHDFNILFGSLNYTKTIIESRVSPSMERNMDTYTLGLDGSFGVRGTKLSWNFSEDITHDHYKEVCEADFLMSSSLGLKLVFPSTLTFQARATLGDNDYYINDSDSNTTDYFFSISRDLRKDLMFDVSYLRKSYNYFGGDNNYAENILKGTLSYKF